MIIMTVPTLAAREGGAVKIEPIPATIVNARNPRASLSCHFISKIISHFKHFGQLPSWQPVSTRFVLVPATHASIQCDGLVAGKAAQRA